MGYLYIGRSLVGLKEVDDKSEAIYIAFEIDDEAMIWQALKNDEERTKVIAKQERERADKAAAAELNAAKAKMQDAVKRMNEAQEEQRQLSQRLDALKDENAKLTQQVEETRNKVNEARQLRYEAYRDQALLQSLLRETRERANAERKVKGGKHHHGYLGVSTSPHEERYHEGTRSHCKSGCWRTVIETPYRASLGVEALDKIVEELTKQQIVRQKILPPLLERIGTRYPPMMPIEGEHENDPAPTYANVKDDDVARLIKRSGNVCYKMQFSADLKRDFWRVTLYTTELPDLHELVILKNQNDEESEVDHIARGQFDASP